MPHIHTKPGQHDHTVSIYIIRTDFIEPKVMLHLHRKFSTYAQFGGHIELNETPWQAAIHELREESGYEMTQLKILQPKQYLKHMTEAVIHPAPAVYATIDCYRNGEHFHTDSAYGVIASQEPTHKPEEGESTTMRLFTRSEIITSDEIDSISKETALYILDECLKNWEQISPSKFS